MMKHMSNIESTKESLKEIIPPFPFPFLEYTLEISFRKTVAVHRAAVFSRCAEKFITLSCVPEQ